MDSALPLLLFLAFLFGSVILILATGYANLSAEYSEEEEDAASVPQPVAARSLFGLATGQPGADVDESVLTDFEHYIEAEERLAEDFVSAPSTETLYLRPGSPPEPSDSLFHSVERFLAEEQTQVEGFVANPSLEGLYGHFGVRALTA